MRIQTLLCLALSFASPIPTALAQDNPVAQVQKAPSEVVLMAQSISRDPSLPPARQYAQIKVMALRHPNDPALAFMEGTTAYYAGEDLAAATALDRAIVLQPDHAPSHFFRGLASSMVGDSKRSLVELQTAVKLDPSPFQFWFEYAMALTRDGQEAEAITAFQTMLTRESPPRFVARAHYRLGNLMSNDKPVALAHWLKSVAADPNHGLSHYNIGQHHQLDGDGEVALIHFQAALSAMPNDVEAMTKVMQAQHRLKQFDAAIPVRSRLRQTIKQSQDPSIRQMTEFCFAQFTTEDGTWFAFESVAESSDELMYRYTFRLSDGNRVVKSVQFEQSAVLKVHNILAVMGWTKDGVHHTTQRHLTAFPPYPKMKKMVLEVHASEEWGTSSEH